MGSGFEIGLDYWIIHQPGVTHINYTKKHTNLASLTTHSLRQPGYARMRFGYWTFHKTSPRYAGRISSYYIEKTSRRKNLFSIYNKKKKIQPGKYKSMDTFQNLLQLKYGFYNITLT